MAYRIRTWSLIGKDIRIFMQRCYHIFEDMLGTIVKLKKNYILGPTNYTCLEDEGIIFLDTNERLSDQVIKKTRGTSNSKSEVSFTGVKT